MKKEASRDVLYHEWVPLTSVLKVLAGSLILLTVTLMVILTITYQYANFFLPVMVSIFSVALLFLVFMILNYRGIEIKITPSEVRVHYGFINRKCISTNEIASCQTTSTTFRRYGGIGIRWGLDGSWAYTTSFGPAVRISLMKGRPFVFSSKYPEKICSIIEELMDRNIALST